MVRYVYGVEYEGCTTGNGEQHLCIECIYEHEKNKCSLYRKEEHAIKACYDEIDGRREYLKTMLGE